MSNPINSNLPSIDPWTASSLLQKSIRRGEAELAEIALRTLLRQRGNAVWRRLVNIAFEDVGIADVDLLHEVSRLACDAQLRCLIGGDEEVAFDLTRRLAYAIKDRSADYLYCIAKKQPHYIVGKSAFAQLTTADRLRIAADTSEPLERRAVSVLSICTEEFAGKRAIANPPLFALLESLEGQVPDSVLHATALAAQRKCDALILMAPILATAFQDTSHRTQTYEPPAVREWNGLPLYVFDMHTSLGKRAISRFAETCPQIRDQILRFVPLYLRREVALWAAFYADGHYTANTLDWSEARRLEQQAILADLMFVGCPGEGVAPIVESARRNLDHLNSIRFSMMESRRAR